MKFIYCGDKEIIKLLSLNYELLLETQTGSYFINNTSNNELEFEQNKVIYTDSLVLGE